MMNSITLFSLKMKKGFNILGLNDEFYYTLIFHS